VLTAFRHSPLVLERFPELRAATLSLVGVDPELSFAAAVDRHQAQARARLAQQSEGEFPEIQAWRRAFSRMGLKPTQYRSAPEALLRRLRSDGHLPALHPLIDLCNALSAAFALPVAVFDREMIAGMLEVRPSSGHERIRSFSGDDDHPDPGEIIFVDEADVAHARRWCHRQSLASVVSAGTTSAYIVAETMHEGGEAALAAFQLGIAQAIAEPQTHGRSVSIKVAPGP
jgi:DNA/RNA-binding domain of Phe-tRNA-synthetase-like protein